MKFRIETNTLKGLFIHLSIVLGLLCILSFAFFYEVLPIATNKEQIVTVPDAKGMTISAAEIFLKSRDLKSEVIDSSYNSDLPPLTVLDQYPKPFSKVKINRSIHLKLNARTPPMVYYPDLTGSGFEFAQKQLKNLDLKIGTVQSQHDIAHNAILESTINGERISAGQRVPKGSKVDLVIGSYKDEFPLPDFADVPFDEAEAYILGRNLKVKEIHYVEDQSRDVNTIQKQLPVPGDTVRRGDEIELWVIKKSQ